MGPVDKRFLAVDGMARYQHVELCTELRRVYLPSCPWGFPQVSGERIRAAAGPQPGRKKEMERRGKGSVVAAFQRIDGRRQALEAALGGDLEIPLGALASGFAQQ